MKILLATDGTKYSDAALQFLSRFNFSDGDQIKIVSVVDMALPITIDIYGGGGGYLPTTLELEKSAQENAEKVLSATLFRAREIISLPNVNISTDTLFGSPERKIVETAEEMKADLIIVGSHGYNRWERLLLGSVSDSVAHHAPCSVLIVRNTSAPGDHPT
jgi:nucleotide-binding universal stress UspA family protein